MSEALNVIESRIVELQKFCQDRASYLQQVEANIKQLKLEKVNVLKQLSEVQGAIQGFAESVKLIKGETAVAAQVTNDVPVVEAQAVEVVPEPVAEPVAAE